MTNLLLTALFMALVFAFLILTAEKTGFLDYLILNTKSDFVFKFLGCNFCMGFWLSVLFFGVVALIFNEPSNLICIILTPVLVRLFT